MQAGLHPRTLLAVRVHRVMGWLALALTMSVQVTLAQLAAAETNPNSFSAIVISLEGSVETLPRSATNWTMAKIGQYLEPGCQLRTGPKSRAMIRLSNMSVLRVGERMAYEIEVPRIAGGKPGLNLRIGSIYFFSRDKPQETQLRTPT